MQYLSEIKITFDKVIEVNYFEKLTTVALQINIDLFLTKYTAYNNDKCVLFINAKCYMMICNGGESFTRIGGMLRGNSVHSQTYN